MTYIPFKISVSDVETCGRVGTFDNFDTSLTDMRARDESPDFECTNALFRSLKFQ